MEPSPGNPVMAAREKKILFHKQFSNVREAIWVDANIRIHARFVHEVSKAGYMFALSRHPSRDCIYEEATACMVLGKADIAAVHHQIADYLGDGYPPHNGMVETGVLYRRNVKWVRELCNAWWREIVKHTHRDQLSFNYVAWKLGAKYDTFPVTIRADDRVEILPHRWHTF